MDAFLDIKLLPDPEFAPSTLMNALFAKLHRALVTHGAGDIGISFPDAGQNAHALGQRLRLHGTSAALEKLMALQWTHGMHDHLIIRPIGKVPARCTYRHVRRVQAKSSPERLRQRRMARQGIDYPQACQEIPDHVAERLRLPYLIVNSRSTGQRFHLFIEQIEVSAQGGEARFNQYGLGKATPVPWF